MILRKLVIRTAQSNKLLDAGGNSYFLKSVVLETIACVLPVSARVNAAVRHFSVKIGDQRCVMIFIAEVYL
jgi:hypothetical protein